MDLLCSWVLDEAYAPFVDNRWRSEALLAFGNLGILRSMTKDQALPGVRLAGSGTAAGGRDAE
jgi:histidinol-phosphate/aromatic aminotransferase/cobyric acid decarboxylase-like protein